MYVLQKQIECSASNSAPTHQRLRTCKTNPDSIAASQLLHISCLTSPLQSSDLPSLHYVNSMQTSLFSGIPSGAKEP